MSVMTTGRGYPYPANGRVPPRRAQLVDVATAIDADVGGVDRKYSQALSNLDGKYAGLLAQLRADMLAAVDDARNLNLFTDVATSEVEVLTTRSDIPGAVHRLPAGVAAQVTATFDVRCDAWNGLSTFAGLLRIFRLSDSVELTAPAGQATYASGVVNGRATVAQTWTVPAAAVGRGLQLAAIKTSPSNAGYSVSPTTTKISVTRARAGASGGA